MRSVLMLGLLAAGAAHADSPQDFAWQWPINAEGDAPAYVLELDAEVLQKVGRSDLRDLAVYNADGEQVPFAPMPLEVIDETRREPLAWLRVPLPAPGQPESLALRLERDADGRLRGLDLRTNDSTPPPPERHDLLVDRGDDPPGTATLHVQLAESAVLPVNLRVRVSASEDLASWQDIGRGLPLVALDDNGLRIERLQLEFTGTNARYLRLAIENEGNWPAIGALQAERRERGADPREWKTLSLEGVAVADAPGTFDYASPAPIAVERVDLALPATNSVTAAQVSARENAEGWWRGVSGFTAFRLGNNGDEVRHIAPDTTVTRDREWRVITRPALTKAPTLLLQYRPERWVLLAQGPRPYTLVAGGIRVAREDYPVQAALLASNTPPKSATLGAGSESAGDAAFAPRRGEDWQRWLLWAVLAVGAGLVLAVSLRVLRQPKAD